MLQAIVFDATGNKRVVVDGVEMEVSEAELSVDELADVEAMQYVAPPVQVPQVITIRQAKLALLAAGLLDDVDAAVAAADRATQIEWEYATEVRRDWPTLTAVQAVAGLTDEQVDGLFITAAAL